MLITFDGFKNYLSILIIYLQRLGWVVGISPIDYSRAWDYGGNAFRGGVFLRDPSPYLRKFRIHIQYAEKI